MSENIKQGDTFSWEHQLLYNDGSAIDLTLVDNVYVCVTLYGETTPTIYKECAVSDATNGKVEVEFDEEDTETAGMYYMEFKCYFPNDNTLTVPSSGKLWLHIESSYVESS